MRIGFVQPDEDLSSGQEAGYLDPAAGVNSEETHWYSWPLTVFLHFCLGQGIIAVVRELIHFFRGP